VQGGRVFPLLQSLREVLKHFFRRGCFSGRALGLLAGGIQSPLLGFGSGFSSSRWRQLRTEAQAAVGARCPAAEWVDAAPQNFCLEKCVGQSALKKGSVY